MQLSTLGSAHGPQSTTTTATTFPQWIAPPSGSETFRPTDARLAVAAPAPASVVSPLEIAFARALDERREAAWERVVIDARRRGRLSRADWEWIWRQIAHADQLGFHAAEAIARIVVADTSEVAPNIAAFFVLLRLTTHPSDAVKVAALESAAELSVPIANWLASRIPQPTRGPLREVIDAIAAMTP